MTEASRTVWDRAVAALPWPLWVYGPDDRLVAANEAATTGQQLHTDLALPGATLEEVLRVLAFRGILGAGDPAKLVARHLALDRRAPWRRLVRDRDGTCREMLGVPLPGGGFIATAVDMTSPYELAEQAQMQSRALDRLLGGLQRGVAAFDLDLRLTFHNAAYEELLALPRGSLRRGLSRDDILRDVLRRGSFLNLDTANGGTIPAPRPHPAAFERERADGRVIAFATRAMPEGGHLIEVGDITALRRAEQQAAHRAALLDGVLEALPHGVVVTGPDGVAAMVNAAHRAIMGDLAARPGEHRAALGLRRALAGEYGPGDAAALVEARLRGPQGHSMACRSRRDGQVIDIRYAPLPDGGHVQVVTDITALDRAEKEAKARSALLGVMLDNMRHGIVLFGPDRRLVAANALAERLIGLPPGRLAPGRHFADLVHEQAQLGEFAGQERAAAGATDRSVPLHYTRMRPDGSVIEVISDPTPDGGFVATYSDITARRAAEHVAAQRAATLQAMLDHSRHGVAMFGPDKRLVAANRLYAEAMRVPQERLVPGASLHELLTLRAAHGGFGSDPVEAAALVERYATLDRGQPVRVQRTTPEGQVFAIGSDPIPGGGWVTTYSDVTALAAAEAEARARAAVLQTTLDHLNHAIVLVGADRRVKLANRLADPLTGLPDGTVQPGMTIEALVDIQRRTGAFGMGEMADRTAASVLALDRTQPQRYQRVLPNNTIVAIASDPTPDGGFVMTSTDVTALRQAEAAAESRAEILAVMLDNMRHGICLFDHSGRVVAANELALRMTGPHPATAAGEELAAIARLQEIPDDWRLATASVADDPPPELAAYRRLREDGAVVEVVTARTPDGGFVRSFTDVTPLVAAEAEARRRGDIQQAMLDNIRYGIILVNAARRIVAANPVVRELLDLPADVVAPGRAFDGFVNFLHANGELGAEPNATLRANAILAADRRQRLRSERARPNGGTVEISSDPTPDGGFVISVSDVTEQRRARAELERARDAAEAADRTKSRFLATMSHELRTPLNAVIGFSEAIRADPDAPRNAEYLAAIGEAGRQLLGLIDDILDVARSETSGVQLHEAPADLGAVATAALRVLSAAAAAGGVALTLDWPDGLPQVRADALRVRQVVLNLLSNAVKFTGRGGKVRVGATMTPEGALELVVVDTGIGMAPADIPRAFEPFVQIDNALSRHFPGSGLGLYLSRALAAAHGAELLLESELGQGTTARLRFPKERLLAA